MCIIALAMWVLDYCGSGKHRKLVFCKLLFQSPESTPDVEFCLQFSSDFFRKASYCGKDRATGQSTNVSSSKVPTPHMLNTGQDVVRAIDRMNSSKPGQGNPDDRFLFSLATFQERRSYWHILCPCMYIKNVTPSTFCTDWATIAAYEENRTLKLPTITDDWRCDLYRWTNQGV